MSCWGKLAGGGEGAAIGKMLVATGDPGKSRPGTLGVAIPKSRWQGLGEVKEAEAGAKSKAISVAVNRPVVV